jgi:hypothetical protein
MSVGVEVLAHARAMIELGELAAAQEELDDALTTVPADPAQADPTAAEAVVLQTGVLLGLGEPYAARGWAAYGYAAHRTLYGDRDRRTLHALGLLAAVLARVGVHGRATQRYGDLITVFTELDGPGSDRVLAARADLATVEHARGHCATARMRLANVVAEHQHLHGRAHPVGIRMLARLAAMWRDCDDFDHAHALLAEARQHAAGLPADDPVHRLLAQAARAPADQRHVCGSGAIPDTPISPAELTMLADAGGQPAAQPRVQPTGPRDDDQPRYAPADVAAEFAADAPIEQWDHLTPAPYEPVPLLLTSRPFSTMSYLPPHPELLSTAPRPRRSPADAPPSAPRRLTQSTLVLVAACIGIVAVTALFLLLISVAAPR